MTALAITLATAGAALAGYLLATFLYDREYNRAISTAANYAGHIIARDTMAAQEEADFWRKTARWWQDHAGYWQHLSSEYQQRNIALTQQVQQLLNERPTDELAQRRARDGEGA